MTNQLVTSIRRNAREFFWIFDVFSIVALTFAWWCVLMAVGVFGFTVWFLVTYL